ncbi:kinase-like protein [Lophium mytilinum]|uniref:EKC/KEOPS complex subunit BUD32 n=1 Tax=Lophium mytilinum TaxID=390894 RepID=A0A6A6R3N8_9PEZI|nr:kinase-like protein [Lophium mytilinum]
MTGYELPEVPLPEKYLPISIAGEGSRGYTYFCIPSKHATISTANEIDLKSLRAKICVVKVVASRRKDALDREVATLMAVQLQGGSLAKRIVQVLDLGGVDELAGPYYAMAPVYGKDLGAFVRSYAIQEKSVPIEFIWHVFLELFSGLAYLHSQRIIHGDLCTGNVMFDSSRQDFPGLPNVVIIDFGSYEVPTGNEEDLKEEMASDAWGAYDAVHRLTWTGYQEAELDPERDPDWANFVNGLNDMKRASGNLARGLKGWEPKDFLSRFRHIAAERRKATPPEVLEEVQGALNLKEIRKTLDEKLRAAVEWHNLQLCLEP